MLRRGHDDRVQVLVVKEAAHIANHSRRVPLLRLELAGEVVGPVLLNVADGLDADVLEPREAEGEARAAAAGSDEAEHDGVAGGFLSGGAEVWREGCGGGEPRGISCEASAGHGAHARGSFQGCQRRKRPRRSHARSRGFEGMDRRVVMAASAVNGAGWH